MASEWILNTFSKRMSLKFHSLSMNLGRQVSAGSTFEGTKTLSYLIYRGSAMRRVVLNRIW